MRALKIKFLCLLFFPLLGISQEQDSLYLGFDEYLEMVKTYHPVVKQARLISDQGAAELLQARGVFDPKIEAGYDRKNFKDISAELKRVLAVFEG